MTTEQMTPSTDDFAAMLDEVFGENERFDGKVVTGTIIALDKEAAVIDIGLKAEGRVQLKEFASPGQPAELAVGDKVDIFVERIENATGEAILSREKARREESWTQLEKSYESEERVNGVIFGRVKGGFTVDLNGAVAFLPGSQVDVRPIRDVTPLMNISQPFQILKMDRKRGNIVVSRRAILEETRAEQRAELITTLVDGQVVEGIVKNITDYGAFVDLGGIDGLLHVTDISWKRINHPSEVLNIGDTIKVQIIRLNPDTQRISLGMKQLQEDPWSSVEQRFPIDSKLKGRITNITDYGAFVELEEGIEGLVHVSEMSWVKKNVHPGKIVSTSQEVEVKVLEIDPEKRRISLGLKQCLDNPWETFAERFPVGSEIEGDIKNITEFGMFIGLDGGDVDGMVHLSDLDWNKSGEQALAEYKKGDVTKAVILDVDVEKERISLGIKQLTKDPMGNVDGLKKGGTVTCTITKVTENGLDVTLGEDDQIMEAFIRRADLSRDRSEQRPERFSVGDKVDAMVTAFDKKSRKIGLSIKALEFAEEKEAVEQYGSSDSGASLGDILGAALAAKKDDE
ncbi:30S ribosomal protein S1 [Paremcibacter congregatus]|uniref:30S ribosomal protein S1 n=1 Tax=Paremcibacter congregatus TaxID=2043170 RepID=A0A2G4YNP8_9PROT|nr:30S ribosomal protein S1 [Paremcibacter congregatus]PHZ83944.1 30S ribosomal protein S1 [Paremcibacter congregatus]QDE25966.1 30S ribosomal protein S1 [Paremcibacter congregatus]|tara:strand:+ start:630 stop:2339 length:1710 start_codon:yes stop_codon:yes gene_type:complete